jgi:predicted dehydrogenase
MIRTALIGLGKMGLSHLSIAKSHPDIDLVAVADTAGYVVDVIERYSGIKGYQDYRKMLETETLDAVLIATPSKLHADMVAAALDKNLHVFCEKPFVLKVEDGERLIAQAEQQNRVTQVGYHFRFVGAFQEAARVVRSGALGHIHHVAAEAYGPVVLRPKGGTWRQDKNEGGGCLYDYACHAVDLLGLIHAVPTGVSGVVRNKIFSSDVEDEVYALLHYADGASGRLSVNWSDESYRKMSTKVMLWGTKGRLVTDRQECQVYLRDSHPSLPEYGTGWTVRYTTELTPETWFYLRGEEYSAQIDHFVQTIKAGGQDNTNSFRSALETDRVIAMLLSDQNGETTPARRESGTTGKSGLFGRFFR